MAKKSLCGVRNKIGAEWGSAAAWYGAALGLFGKPDSVASLPGMLCMYACFVGRKSSTQSQSISGGMTSLLEENKNIPCVLWVINVPCSMLLVIGKVWSFWQWELAFRRAVVRAVWGSANAKFPLQGGCANWVTSAPSWSHTSEQLHLRGWMQIPFALPRQKGNEVLGSACVSCSGGSLEVTCQPSEPQSGPKATCAAVAFPATSGRWQSHQHPRSPQSQGEAVFLHLLWYNKERLTQFFLIQVYMQMDFLFFVKTAHFNMFLSLHDISLM